MGELTGLKGAKAFGAAVSILASKEGRLVMAARGELAAPTTVSKQLRIAKELLTQRIKAVPSDAFHAQDVEKHRTVTIPIPT